MMMMITQKNVRKDASQLSLCNTELKQEKIISALANNNKGALTNCASERRVAIIEKAITIKAMKTDNDVHDPQKEILIRVGAIDIDTPCNEPLNE